MENQGEVRIFRSFAAADKADRAEYRAMTPDYRVDLRPTSPPLVVSKSQPWRNTEIRSSL